MQKFLYRAEEKTVTLMCILTLTNTTNIKSILGHFQTGWDIKRGMYINQTDVSVVFLNVQNDNGSCIQC